jgi:hypothetical protein
VEFITIGALVECQFDQAAPHVDGIGIGMQRAFRHGDLRRLSLQHVLEEVDVKGRIERAGSIEICRPADRRLDTAGAVGGHDDLDRGLPRPALSGRRDAGCLFVKGNRQGRRAVEIDIVEIDDLCADLLAGRDQGVGDRRKAGRPQVGTVGQPDTVVDNLGAVENPDQLIGLHRIGVGACQRLALIA